MMEPLIRRRLLSIFMASIDLIAEHHATSAGGSRRSAAPRRSPRRCRWWRRRRCARRSRRRLPRRPFAQLLYRIQRQATTHAVDFTHPLLESARGPQARGHPRRRRQGPVRRAQQQRVPAGRPVRSGRRPCSSPPDARRAQFVARTGRQLVAEFAYGDTPRFAEARAIAAFARDLFLKRRSRRGADRRDALRQHADAGAGVRRVSAGRRDHKALKMPGVGSGAKRLAADTTEVLFEPSPEAVLGYLLRPLPQHLHLPGPAERQGQRAERAHGGDEERDRQRRRR